MEEDIFNETSNEIPENEILDKEEFGLVPAAVVKDERRRVIYTDEEGNIEDERYYADAHYIPYDERNEPPRYYTPRKGEGKHESRRLKLNLNAAAAKIAAACLACLVLGAAAGSAITTAKLDGRVTALEEYTSATPTPQLAVAATAAPVTGAVSAGSYSNASDIYELACSQTVSISTEVAYTDFFGRGYSSGASSAGSGIIATTDGYILTNCHVVSTVAQQGGSVYVSTYDGQSYPATIVGIDDTNDIAVLKIDAEELNAAVFGDSDSLRVGDEVYAVGNPLGQFDFSMSFGRVSALNRSVSTSDSDNPITMFQLDAAVNSGNSGGPVYNSAGEIVGVVTAKYEKNGVEGLGFAIPVNDAVKIASDLINKGYVSGRAYLGVTVDERYTEVYASYFRMPYGAYVYSVEEGSPLEKAGIVPGDVIVSFNGERVESRAELKAALLRCHADDTVEIQIFRDGEYYGAELTLAEATGSANGSSKAF